MQPGQLGIHGQTSITHHGGTTLYSHSCRNAGAGACGFKTTASSESDLRASIAAHVKAKHKVPRLTDTIYNYLRHVASR